MKKIFLSIIFISQITNLFAQMTVDSTATPAQLVSAITGGGIAVSNIQYTGASTASGTFQCTGTCNIGISGGIILTTGSATLADSLNIGTGQGTSNNLNGDADLDSLTTGATHDASILEFDFNAISDTAKFNFVFASEEYSDYVNSFNDVFGFFISGPAIAGKQNIALIPGTSLPVTINNVNNGYAPAGTVPTGPCMNCAYFLDNTLSTYSTAYDAMTTVLTAVAANLQPGQTYHLKIGIADVLDWVFDSGVFLETGSFLSPAPAWIFAGGNKIMNDTVHICQGNSVTLSAPAGFVYNWNTGATTQSITVNTSGNYAVQIIGSNPAFPILSAPIHVIVDVATLPIPVLSLNNNILISSTNSPSYNYSWTLNGLPVIGADSSSLPFSQSGCYAVTVQSAGGCLASSDTLCTQTLGVSKINIEEKINIFPNPFDKSCTLIFDNANHETFMLSVFDVTGKTELQKEIKNNKTIIKKGNLEGGIYFYELRNASGNKIYRGKFVVK